MFGQEPHYGWGIAGKWHARGERAKLQWSKITKDKKPNDKRNPKTKKISSTKHQTQMRCSVLESRRDDLLLLTLNLFRGASIQPLRDSVKPFWKKGKTIMDIMTQAFFFIKTRWYRIKIRMIQA
jgi:hypothetical protein